MKKYTESKIAGILRYLSKCGCRVQREHGLKVDPTGLSIQQILIGGLNRVFDLDDGRSAWVLDMRVTNESNCPVRVSDVQVTTPWGGSRLSLLPNPASFHSTYQSYDFPGEGLGFPRSMVLNDFLCGKRKLNPGLGISGLLLGIAEDPIPSDLPEHGQTVVELGIFDGQGNRFASDFILCLDRSSTVARERKNKTAVVSQSKSRLKGEPSAA